MQILVLLGMFLAYKKFVIKFSSISKVFSVSFYLCNFFVPKNMKKLTSKVAHNRSPRNFCLMTLFLTAYINSWKFTQVYHNLIKHSHTLLTKYLKIHTTPKLQTQRLKVRNQVIIYIQIRYKLCISYNQIIGQAYQLMSKNCGRFFLIPLRSAYFFRNMRS